jgi:hypothetical protein
MQAVAVRMYMDACVCVCMCVCMCVCVCVTWVKAPAGHRGGRARAGRWEFGGARGRSGAPLRRSGRTAAHPRSAEPPTVAPCVRARERDRER